MQIHNLVQGSPEWKSHRATRRNASDAPAMMGCSPYKTRTQLLHEMHTGVSPEVDPYTQRLFDDGHRYEALARPLGERIVGDELYPVVGSEGRYSASFDGLTMDETTGFEHKSLNEELSSAMVDGCTGADLPKVYRVQMEQQCMVSGCERILFMASKWEGDQLSEERHCWYYPDTALRAEIVAGWEQFDKDLAEYVPVEVMPAVVAAPTLNLPAVSVQVKGSIALISNLDLFGDALKVFISRIPEKPSTDQEFADCKSAIGKLQDAQDALDAAEANALGQIATFDEMRRTKALYFDLARTTRLSLEKLVTAREAAIKVEITQGGKDKLAEHIASLNTRLGKPYMPVIVADFATAIKNKRTVASLQNAVDTLLSQKKIEANAVADKIQINLTTLRELAVDYKFLFSDADQIVLKANDDLTSLVKLRITEHKAAEEKRLAAERELIRKEEADRLECAQKEEDALIASIWSNARRIELDSVPYIQKAIGHFESGVKDFEGDSRPRVVTAIAEARAEMSAKLVAAQQKQEAEAKLQAEQALAAAKQSTEGRELPPATQPINEAEGAQRFAQHHPMLVKSLPEPVGWPFPSDPAARQAELVARQTGTASAQSLAKRPAVDNRPPITTGALCELAGSGVSITAAFIQSLGINPTERPKEAKSGTYWAAADVPVIFNALARHFEQLANTESALAA